MTELPGLPTTTETTIDRVTAMTLIIPIRQGLEPPYFDPTGAPVRPVDNLRTVLELVPKSPIDGNPLYQIATIHYARWVIINEGQDLLFCSNFDTSFDQYLSDFLVIADRHDAGHIPWMDLVWGPCVGYPGGSDVNAFTEWARSWQIDTTLFFPTISDMTVRDSAWLRKFKHLFDEFDESTQCDDWPPELKAKYEAFKRRVDAIDVSVVT